MPIQTLTLTPESDSRLNQQNPSFNYGGAGTVILGALTSNRNNPIMRFEIPNYTGVVKSIKLRVYVTIISGRVTGGVHVVDNPYDDLWIEGTSNHASDPEGCSWDEYVVYANWPTPGGDFSADPIGIIVIQAADPINQYYEINIPIDNFTPQSGKKQSFILTVPDATVASSITFQTRQGANKPELVIEIEVDDIPPAPVLNVTDLSSTEIELDWTESTYEEANFQYYHIEGSPTGAFAGEEYTITTITDKEITTFIDSGLVLQSDVDDTDPDNDTYPTGRTVFYRISTVTVFGTQLSSVESGTTIPAMKPVSLAFFPKSYYANEFVIDDNIDYSPYGVQVIPSWLSESDTTPIAYVDRLVTETFFRQASTWPTTPNEVTTFNPIDWENGGVIIGDSGYKPYKIRGQVYDTGGLYRKCIAQDHLRFEDDFDDPGEVVGTKPSKWFGPQWWGVFIDNTQFYSSPNCMRFDGNSARIELVPLQSGISNIFFKFRTVSSGSNQLRLKLLDSFGPPTIVATLEIAKNSGRINVNNIPSATGHYVANQWYEIQMYNDWINQTTTVYIVDLTTQIKTLVLANVPFFNPGTFTDWIQIDCGYTLIGHYFWVDDVRLDAGQQFEAALPAPCPVAIPDGPEAVAPPDMGGPYVSGSSIPVDLSIAGQQIGEAIYTELFTGSPGDTGKYGWYNVLSNTPVYMTGVGGKPIMRSQFNGIGNAEFTFWKKLKGQDTPTTINDIYFSKYTGGYTLKSIFRFGTGWTLSGNTVRIAFNVNTWNNNPLTLKGYMIQFRYPGVVEIIRYPNWGSGGAVLLLTGSLGTHSPVDHTNRGDHLYFEIITSPYFGPLGEGNIITVIYNLGTSYNDCQNIDYESHPYIFTVVDVGKPADEQTHYTGQCVARITAGSADAQSFAPFEVYMMDIIGRVNGQGYGAKNLTTGDILELQESPTPSFPVYCEPDQLSQAVLIEGRIKNSYGAQSRTGEVDGYQGDTFTNVVPTAILYAPTTTFKDQTTTLNGSQSFDPEGGDLLYEFDFGDGSPFEVTTNPITGHVYTVAGTYTARLRVQDEVSQWSSWVTTTITVVDYSIVPVLTFLAQNPFTSISPVRSPGLSQTPLPGLTETYLQNGKEGGRAFDVTGYTAQCDTSKPFSELIADTKAELDVLDFYAKEGIVVEIDFPFYGVIKGVITGYNSEPNPDNISIGEWSFTFVEVTQYSLGAV